MMEDNVAEIGDWVESIKSGAIFEVLGDLVPSGLKLKCLAFPIRGFGHLRIGDIIGMLPEDLLFHSRNTSSVITALPPAALPPAIAEREAHEQCKRDVIEARQALRRFLNG